MSTLPQSPDESTVTGPYTLERLLGHYTLERAGILQRICKLGSHAAPRFWFDPTTGRWNGDAVPGYDSLLLLARHHRLTATQFGQLVEDVILVVDARPREVRRSKFTGNRLYSLP